MSLSNSVSILKAALESMMPTHCAWHSTVDAVRTPEETDAIQQRMKDGFPAKGVGLSRAGHHRSYTETPHPQEGVPSTQPSRCLSGSSLIHTLGCDILASLFRGLPSLFLQPPISFFTGSSSLDFRHGGHCSQTDPSMVALSTRHNLEPLGKSSNEKPYRVSSVGLS